MAIITISRASLSGGEELARKLQSKLGYKTISRECVLQTAASRYHVEISELAKGMEQPPTFWQRMSRMKKNFILAVQATVAEMVEDGDAIYYGQAGHLLLRNAPGVLKLRLISPIEHRILRAKIEKNMPREVAIKHIQEVDSARSNWVHKMYDLEWEDPSLYDLVINFAEISFDDAVSLVVGLVGSDKRHPTSEDRKKLLDFSLQKRLQAELSLNSIFPENSISFRVSEGQVELDRTDFVLANERKVLNFISEISGVNSVFIKSDQERPSSQITGSSPLVRDLMVPIDNYPHVHELGTIRNALLAVGASSVRLKDGHLLSPRYVVIVGDDQRLVGVLSRRDLLRGLSPHNIVMENSLRNLGGFFSLQDYKSIWPSSWLSLLTPAAVKNANSSVSPLVKSTEPVVDIDDEIDKVIEQMLDHSVDIIPVVDGNKVVGVVLMTDVFDNVAQYVLEATVDNSDGNSNA